MSVGYPVDKSVVDQRAGTLALQLRSTFDEVVTFKTWLDSQTDAALTALGYTSGEITLLRSSYTDLDNLRRVARGLQATGASDFFFNAKLLTGVQ